MEENCKLFQISLDDFSYKTDQEKALKSGWEKLTGQKLHFLFVLNI